MSVKLNIFKGWDWNTKNSLDELVESQEGGGFFTAISDFIYKTQNQISALERKIMDIFENESPEFQETNIRQDDGVGSIKGKFQTLKNAAVNLHHLIALFTQNNASARTIEYASCTGECSTSARMLYTLSFMVARIHTQLEKVEKAYSEMKKLPMEQPKDEFTSFEDFHAEFKRIQNSNLDKFFQSFSTLSDSVYQLTLLGNSLLEMLKDAQNHCPHIFNERINFNYYLNKLVAISPTLKEIQGYYRELATQTGSTYVPGLLSAVEDSLKQTPSIFELFETHWFNEKNPFFSLLFDEKYLRGEFTDEELTEKIHKFDAYQRVEVRGKNGSEAEIIADFRKVLQTLKNMTYPINITNLLDPDMSNKIKIENHGDLVKLLALYKNYYEKLHACSKKATNTYLKSFLEAIEPAATI